jgi:molybdopterin/thiamine biosynthesis adenylyltransferase
MTNVQESELSRCIQEKSRKIADPAGRDVSILEDSEATKLAEQFQCGAPRIYREALRLGICPYRYVRNREVISVQEQLKLALSRVVVIGLGGLGGQIVLLLARIGLGHLVVVDCDAFDETNLNRQALSSTDAIGKPKSEVAAATVTSINPGVEVTSIQARIEAATVETILGGSDVVVDALDNIPDRMLLGEAAKDLGIPLVHGAIAGFEGQLMTVFPKDNGLQQLYGDVRTERDDPQRPEALLGVPTLTPAIVASFQAMEVVKIILNRGRLLRNRMVHFDLERGELNQLLFEDPDSTPSS